MTDTIATILSALISAAGAVIVCMISQNRLVSLIIYRIEQLEKKQDKYNGVIARTYELEKNEAVLEEEIKVANHRIDDLEAFHKP